MSQDCIFCKMVKEEIPCSTVLNNGKIFAILDIHPVSKGHVLIIPKDHYDTLIDIPENVLKDVIVAAKKVGKAQRKALKADGFNLRMNNFPAAGQEVMHAHLHVVPRFEGDGAVGSWAGKAYDEGEIDSVREKIATFL
jgi:histidine triad (HIT) family protein